MNRHFLTFLNFSQWSSALMVILYHLRFLLFADYARVQEKTLIIMVFYFLTGLGHEAFVVFFVSSGLTAGSVFLRQWRNGGVDYTVDVSNHFIRAYLVLVPALILGGMLDLAGLQFFNESGVYTRFPAFSTVTLTLASLTGNLLMLQPFLVPTFGSNGMLYLFSYLMWSSCILLIFSSLGLFLRKRRHGKLLAAGLLLLLPAFLPAEFTLWLMIWLLGAGVMLAGESPRFPKLHPAIGIILFLATIVLSRLIGSNSTLLPEPFGQALTLWKYLFVGLGFSLLALAMVQRQPKTATEIVPLSFSERINNGLASFSYSTLFIHFPIMMFLVGAGADLLHKDLMQQPGWQLFAYFFLAAAVLYGLTFVVSLVTERHTGTLQAYFRQRLLAFS